MLVSRDNKRALAKGSPLLAYWDPNAVRSMVQAATDRRNGERNALFIRTVFVGALRCSEALALTPGDVGPGAVLRLRVAKGRKPRPVAITQAVADALLAYARRTGLGDAEPFFPFSRHTALRIVKRAAQEAQVWVPGTRTHLLRHSGAIERLRQHGNPRALQLHLGHARPDTTLRYLTTLQLEEAVRLNQEVDPEK